MEDIYEILKNRVDHINPEDDYVPDISGWIQQSFAYSFSKASNGIEAPCIVEVGSWKGSSAIQMAKLSPGSKIICVDTWLGSPEHFDQIGKYGELFNTFVKNIKALGLQDQIYPLPLPSLQAIEILKRYNVQPDIIYIDAAHEYLPVKMDLEAYWEILKPGGTFMGDDFHSTWPGVIKAVEEFVTENGTLPANVDYVTWSIHKLFLTSAANCFNSLDNSICQGYRTKS